MKKRLWFVNFFFKLTFFTCIVFNLTQAQVFVPVFRGSDPVSLSPSGTIYLLPGDNLQLQASGGMGVYNWSNTGAAQADGALLTYTPSLDDVVDYDARLTSYTNDTITMTSPGYANITRTVRTYDPLDISPTAVTLAAFATQQFNVSDGYCTGVPGACTNAQATWSIVSGGGSISATGLFTAPGVNDTTVVQVADSIGNTATATVTTVAILTISTATLKLPVYSTMNYSAVLGTTPYTYSVPVGTGTVGCSTTLNGAHTAGVGTITVASTAGCPSRGVIFIGTEQICYTGTTATTFTGSNFGGTNVLRGCNGTTAAAYANGVAVNSNRTVYTAPATIGAGKVRVTDNVGASSDSTITHIKPVDIVKGSGHACALYDEGSVKCWGENTNGRLGIGSTSTVGDLGTELGGANSFVDLGVGRTATKLVTGNLHTCALLDDSTVKCWGNNANGQLGIGSTTASTTPALVNFGAKTPADIWAFGLSTCVKYTDNSSVCWGLNTRGQAGQGTTTNITSPPATALNFGGGLTATKFAGSTIVTCALLSDASVQCWGDNSAGYLGYGDTTARNAPSGVAVNLGGGRTALDISGYSVGTGTTSVGNMCAALDNFTVKCWGRNNRGQIGDNTTTDRNVPTATTTLGFNATSVYVGREYSCAKATAGYMKCWGRNIRGQLMIGSATQQNSAAYCSSTLNGAHTAAVTTITVAATTNCPSAGKIVIGTEVICYTGTTAATFTGATRGCDGTTAAAYGNGTATVGIINWGTGIGLSKVSAGGRGGCILTGGGVSNNDRIKCWGDNLNTGASAQSGTFLYHSTVTGTTNSSLGDAVGELGDNLPFVNH